MPVLCEFDSQTICNPHQPDSRATVCFPRQLVARPRLPHGIRTLDVDKSANIRITSTLSYSTSAWVDCHVSTWWNTTVYRGIDSIFVLTPADLDFLTVVVFLNKIDLDNKRNWRLSVSASNIDGSGFTLHIETWGDTVFYGARACWIAYPEDREHIFSTSVNTMDLESGPVTKPQPKHSRDITFGTVGFWKKPSVFVALNFLDIDCKANLRINAYVDGVTQTGLVCHIDYWDDTVLYAAGVSIIAFV